MSKYPRLGEWRAPKATSGRTCAVCSGTPAGLQFVEVNYFRGDDVAVACCDMCRKTRKQEVLDKA